MRSPHPFNMCEFSSLRMLRKNGWSVVDSCNPEPGDWRTYSQKPGARVSPARTSGTSCSGAKEHIVNRKKLTKYLEKFLSLAVFNSLYTCVHKFAEAASGA